MGDLSDRFATLMARMAKSDAALYRAIGEQNAQVRQMVDELVPSDDQTAATTKGLLPTAALLPEEECDQSQLKKRFGKVAEAQAWIEGRIGPGPKRPSWAVITQTCRTGSWPAKSISKAKRAHSLSVDELDARLIAFEERLDQRLSHLEALLLLIAEANGHCLPLNGGAEPKHSRQTEVIKISKIDLDFFGCGD